MRASKSIIGFASSACPPGSGAWYDTFIGGHAVFPADIPLEDVNIPACERCAARRKLVVQAYAPSWGKGQRVLYVFACERERCAGGVQGWYALEVWRVEEEVKEEKVREEAGVEAVCWDSDSEGSERSEASEEGREIAKALQELSVMDKESSGPESGCTVEEDCIADQGATTDIRCENTELIQSDEAFPSFYISVLEEGSESSDINDLLSHYENGERSRNETGEDEEEEGGEERISERIARAPGQVLRYGECIWETDGAVCEMQLLGSVVHYLGGEGGFVAVGVHAGEGEGVGLRWRRRRMGVRVESDDKITMEAKGKQKGM